jgi:diaminopimelate decarboxylase
MTVISPNINLFPVTSSTNAKGHLTIGGVDTVDLAEEYGTPLWIIDEETIIAAIKAYKEGLKDYPNSQILYAGKAFLCLAMCSLIRQFDLGLDVVSHGELHTALTAGFPPDMIYMHGNNKTKSELIAGLKSGNVNIIIDNLSELEMIVSIAQEIGHKASIFIRIIPDVETDTHDHIQTGHSKSKFGLALQDLPLAMDLIEKHSRYLKLLGLHAHIGSQTHELEPYFQMIEVMANNFVFIKQKYNIELAHLDIGGGLGIAYTKDDPHISIYEWTNKIVQKVKTTFEDKNISLPKLLIEPGRSIIGPAGVTLYKTGHKKVLPDGTTYLGIDGGMADNPRPITYQAKYTAVVANRMNENNSSKPITLVGKYCESGDIIVKDAYINAQSNDIVAIFSTGAYNYSMASNYNRTGRPACVLVKDGKADLIIVRETNDDLLAKDLLPTRLKR